jgi:hypothetical protein
MGYEAWIGLGGDLVCGLDVDGTYEPLVSGTGCTFTVTTVLLGSSTTGTLVTSSEGAMVWLGMESKDNWKEMGRQICIAEIKKHTQRAQICGEDQK